MPKRTERNCRKCGTRLEILSAKHKFCSPECRQVFHRAVSTARRKARRREAAPLLYERECPGCHIAFETQSAREIWCQACQARHLRPPKQCAVVIAGVRCHQIDQYGSQSVRCIACG